MGRFTKSRLEVPRAPDTVEPNHSPSSNYFSGSAARPGPVFGHGNGAFQAATSGKYTHPLRTSPRPDALSLSSKLRSVDEEMLAVAERCVADGPGRMYRGIEVEPRFPVTAVPFTTNTLSCLSSSQHSRPGPVNGTRSGVSRALLSGKYMWFPRTILPPDVPEVFSQRYVPTTEPQPRLADNSAFSVPEQ